MQYVEDEGIEAKDAPPGGRVAGDLVSFAQRAVRRKLLSGEFRGGDRIREAELAREFGTSRAPVREALRLLERSGLVLKSQNRSYVVKKLTEHDIFELSTLRVALESMAAQLAFGRAKLVDGMRMALNDMRAAAADNDYGRLMASDRAFHQAIIDAADHGRLKSLYAVLGDQMQLAFIEFGHRMPDLMGTIQRHEELFACATDEGNAGLLVKKLTGHIQRNLNIMQNIG